MWFFRCFPKYLPLLDTTTAVFQITSPCVESRSKIGEIITMPYFLANWNKNYSVMRIVKSIMKYCWLVSFEITSCKWRVVGPVSASSANSHHGCFSRVQKANGIAKQNYDDIFKHNVKIPNIRTFSYSLELTPSFLKAKHIHTRRSSSVDNFRHLFHDRITLITNFISCWSYYGILNSCYLKHQNANRIPWNRKTCSRLAVNIFKKNLLAQYEVFGVLLASHRKNNLSLRNCSFGQFQSFSDPISIHD